MLSAIRQPLPVTLKPFLGLDTASLGLPMEQQVSWNSGQAQISHNRRISFPPLLRSSPEFGECAGCLSPPVSHSGRLRQAGSSTPGSERADLSSRWLCFPLTTCPEI